MHVGLFIEYTNHATCIYVYFSQLFCTRQLTVASAGCFHIQVALHALQVVSKVTKTGYLVDKLSIYRNY